MTLNMRVQTLDKPKLISKGKVLSTREVTKAVGISPATLERWLAEKRLPKPKSIKIGGKEFRDWSLSDVAAVREYKAKHYRKGRGRKK